MRKFLGFIFIIVALTVAGGVVAVATKSDYWLLSPKEKFLRSWQDDLNLLQKRKALPEGFSHLKSVEIRSDNSPASEWVESLRSKIPLDPTGTYQLKIMVVHWIDGNKYGTIVQYTLVDTRSGNTVWEISRTLHLGYLI